MCVGPGMCCWVPAWQVVRPSVTDAKRAHWLVFLSGNPCGVATGWGFPVGGMCVQCFWARGWEKCSQLGRVGNTGPNSPKTLDFSHVRLAVEGPWGLQAARLANACVRIRKAPTILYTTGAYNIFQACHLPRK